LFTTDTFDLYIGNGTTNTRFQKYIASGATTQILRGDGSLYTFPLAISSPSNGQVLKYNGTSWVNDSDAGITGSGSAGQVAYFTGATTQGGSNNLFWDSANARLGIGTASPAGKLEVNGLTFINNTADTTARLLLRNTTTGASAGGLDIREIGVDTSINNASNGNMYFSTNNTERVRFFAAGNVGIGTGASDSGQLLQVAGTARIFGTSAIPLLVERTTASSNVNIQYKNATTSFYAGLAGNNNFSISTAPTLTTGEFQVASNGNVLINTSGADSGEKLQVTGTMKVTGASSIGGNLTVDTNTLFVDATANRVGIGTTNPSYTFHTVSADSTIGAFRQSGAALGQLLVGNTAADLIIRILASGDALIASDTSKYLALGTSGTERMRLDASGNLGLGVTPSAWTLIKPFEIGNAGNFFAGFQGGSAVYMGAGAYYNSGWKYATTGDRAAFYDIGDGSFKWNTAASGTAGNAITFTQAMTLYSTGNLALGLNADSGERLQVTGTAKITGNTTFSAYVTAARYLVTPSGSSIVYNIVNSDNTYTGSYALQAGGGSAGYGGGLMMYGHSHASKAGWVTAGISANSGGKFSVNTQGLGGGTDIFTVDPFGNTVVNGNLTVGGTAGAVGTMQVIKTGGTPVSNQLLFGTDGTGYQFAIGKNQGGTITNLVTISDTGAATFTGNLTVDTNTLFVDAAANEVGIGTTSPNSTLHIAGSVTTAIVAKTANYTATVSDYTILCDTTGGGFTITLPAANTCTGRIYVIKKVIGNSGVNNVTIDGNGAETIDGAATITLQCKSSVMIQSDGANWYILSLYSDTSCL
jgi:hypothetical protein